MANQAEEEHLEPVSTNENLTAESQSDDLTVEIDMSEGPADDQTDEIDISSLLPDAIIDMSAEQTAVIVNQSFPTKDDSRFQIHYSLLKDRLPTIIVFHCSGNMVESNCLILHNTFKICTSKNLPFIVFDLSEVTAIEKEVWNYFSSKAAKLRKLNGIVLFSGIRSDVLSDTTDFHKLDICHCESVDVCLTVIQNLAQEHEKIAYFPEYLSDNPLYTNKPVDIKEFFKLESKATLSNPDFVYLNKIQIDDSMSTDYSIGEQNIAVTIDDSMGVDFSPNDKDKLINMPTASIAIDDVLQEEGNAKTENNSGKSNQNDPYLNHYGIFGDGKFENMTDISGNNQYSNTIVFTIEDKIHTIISQNGPCSFGKIKKILESGAFGSEKISSLNLLKILKEMNLESNKKRIRYYRSC